MSFFLEITVSAQDSASAAPCASFFITLNLLVWLKLIFCFLPSVFCVILLGPLYRTLIAKLYNQWAKAVFDISTWVISLKSITLGYYAVLHLASQLPFIHGCVLAHLPGICWLHMGFSMHLADCLFLYLQTTSLQRIDNCISLRQRKTL